MDYIAFLKDAIQALHGCAATHIETVPVKERFKGETVWEGEVGVFDVPDRPKADQLFAWGYQESDGQPDMKAVTVLAIPPITTPQRAVQAYVVSEIKREQENASQEEA